VLSECAKSIENRGLETETVYLRGKTIESCRACGKCSEIYRCRIDDGLNEIIEKIKDSKGFIVGTPVYFGTARGDLMAALQRIGYVSMNTNRFLSWKSVDQLQLQDEEIKHQQSKSFLCFTL